ncbi:hypothetical protein HNR42_002038 [Deinobacterium chartae]|uniref:Uncharacterized protein n=1 Tax=Deinobacterium chartae TaxID=521158 RepID=A0A841I0V2_9DEIO|nr:hypothetical protein [Deinobacterium chartae]MBB6098604.1 hypothetical protein [Deinobacterium chartae]
MPIRLSTVLYALGFFSIAVSAMNYLPGRAKTGSEKERDGLFVGEWVPTFFILGKIAEDREHKRE